MKKFELNATKRDGLGKKDAKALRINKLVPGVLYGAGTEMHFGLRELELAKIIYTADVYQVNLNIDGEKRSAILKDIQFHPVSDKVIHVDFLELIEGKEINTPIPVKLVGSAVGVKAGGKLVSKVRKLTVRALPKDLPENITINVESLEIGKNIRVSDITVKGVQILDVPSNVIVGVKATRQSAAAAEPAKK